MTEYLDKAAILETVSNQKYREGATWEMFQKRIERGEFDAKGPVILCGQRAPLLNAIEELNVSLAEKDAEIARLKEVIRKTAHCHGELQREMFKQRDRIAQQDQELKDLGKALQYKCQMREAAEQKEPLKDEPELWICPDAKQCGDARECAASSPHKKGATWCDDINCVRGLRSGPCIPYKKEEPMVPQMQQPAPHKNTVAGALNQAIEAEGRRIDAYAKKQVDFDMRLDALEKNKNLINVLDFQLKGVADCVDKLEKEIATIKEKEGP